MSFAEAKHAANIAFVVACIAAIMSVDDLNMLLYGIAILLLGSGLCSLFAIYPKLDKKGVKEQRQRESNDNLIYYDVIKTYVGRTEEYLKRVEELYFSSETYIFTRYQIDLANEIILNSKIASDKYILLKYAVSMDILALAILLTGFIIA